MAETVTGSPETTTNLESIVSEEDSQMIDEEDAGEINEDPGDDGEVSEDGEQGKGPAGDGGGDGNVACEQSADDHDDEDDDGRDDNDVDGKQLTCKGSIGDSSNLPDDKQQASNKGNQNEEELDFEGEENDSLEEGEEESDADNSKNANQEDKKQTSAKGSLTKKRVDHDGGDNEEDEDGEVNSDDDLEEGEVKEDDESGNTAGTGGEDGEVSVDGQKRQVKKSTTTTNATNQQAKTSICRFFAKGQCTWGLNCRFLHLAAPVVALPIKLPNQRGFPYQVGLHPTGLHPTGVHPTGVHPTGAHPTGAHSTSSHPTGAHPTGPHPTGHHSTSRSSYRSSDDHDHPIPFPHLAPPINRHQAAQMAAAAAAAAAGGHLPSHPPSTSQSSSSNAESAWERGLRHAKEMLVKAHKRKEEEVDFDDKRFNIGVAEDEGTSHSRHSHHSRDSPESGDYDASPARGGARSPHNYHSRDRDRDKRPHPRESRDTREGRDIRVDRESRDTRDKDSRSTRDTRDSRDDHWNSEYERRRRLAFESAPWNDEQSPPPAAPSRSTTRSRETAEMYRDPWRRSKSPPTKWAGSRRVEGSSGSKRSHSMSSISGSESVSDLSGSESISGSGDSFTGSEVSYTDASDASGRSPREDHHRKSRSRKEPRSRHDREVTKPRSRHDLPPPSSHHSSRDRGGPPVRAAPVRDRLGPVSGKSRSSRSSIDEEASGSGPRKKSGHAAPPPPPPPPPPSKPRRDSWSDSDSGSMSRSDSSLYSGSESGESEAFSEASDIAYQDERRSKSYRGSKEMVRSHPPPRQSFDHPSRKPQRSRGSVSPPSSHHVSNPKKMKMSASVSTTSREDNIVKSRHSSASNDDPGAPSPPPTTISKKSIHQSPSSPNDAPQKKLIKMTFKKKHSNLKKDNVVTAKLNGGKNESEDESEPSSGVHQSPSPFGESDDSISRKGEETNTSLPSKGIPPQPPTANNKASIKSSSGSAKVSSTTDGSSSRREHLLKQLEVVEAMIAKKKAKLQ